MGPGIGLEMQIGGCDTWTTPNSLNAGFQDAAVANCKHLLHRNVKLSHAQAQRGIGAGMNLSCKWVILSFGGWFCCNTIDVHDKCVSCELQPCTSSQEHRP